jgi:hypothetical protein
MDEDREGRDRGVEDREVPAGASASTLSMALIGEHESLLI